MELVQGVTAAKAPPPRPDTYNTSKNPSVQALCGKRLCHHLFGFRSSSVGTVVVDSLSPLLFASMRWDASLAFAWVGTTETVYPMASNLFKTNSEHILRAE